MSTELLAWMIIAVAISAIAVGSWALFRWLRRWPQLPPGKDPRAMRAESELWSTRGGGDL